MITCESSMPSPLQRESFFMKPKLRPGDLARLKLAFAESTGSLIEGYYERHVLVDHYSAHGTAEYPPGTLCIFVRNRGVPGFENETCSEIFIDGRLGWVYNAEVERADEAG